jgi:hypothetical protein
LKSKYHKGSNVTTRTAVTIITTAPAQTKGENIKEREKK